MTERRLTAVIFDLDGTLIDPANGIIAAIRGVLATLDARMPPRAELAWCVGPPLREIFKQLLEPDSKSALVDRAVSLYVQNYAQVAAAESVAYPGVPPMLSELCAAAARLYVVTSRNRAVTERVLEQSKLRRYFDDVSGNARLDDNGDAVRDVIERAELDRTATAIVGDRPHDVVAGKRNGICSIGVTYGHGCRDELANAGADHICETPAELTRLLLDD